VSDAEIVRRLMAVAHQQFSPIRAVLARRPVEGGGNIKHRLRGDGRMLKKIFVIFAFPAIFAIFMAGWILCVFGEDHQAKKEAQRASRSSSVHG
jgi:hypothetical protein